ncbi:MAG: LLM class flavin-dependent oxidoreductase [Saprospiraceae bacterium]|nr:LLM class flavin-dependent oxidoreductase [Lewinella sp.]
MELSFLDFGNVSDKKINSHLMIENVFTLAARLDELGCKRLWLGEHYGIEQRVSWFSPRQILPLLLANTENMRIGSGGEIITYHSPLLLAHDYTFLSAVFGDRVDLGLAKSIKLPEKIEVGMCTHLDAPMDTFIEKVQKIHLYLQDESQHDILMPLVGVKKPQMWFLGTRRKDYDWIIEMEGNLALSLHHSHQLLEDPEVLTDYQEKFRDRHGYRPEILMSVACYCVGSEAERAAKISELKTTYLKNSIDRGALVDSPENIYHRLAEIKAHFGLTEVMIHNDSREIEEKNRVLSIFEYAGRQAPTRPLEALSAVN